MNWANDAVRACSDDQPQGRRRRGSPMRRQRERVGLRA